MVCQGAATVRRMVPDAISIFLVASSEAELVARLVARKTEPLDKMLVRVETARAETSAIEVRTPRCCAMPLIVFILCCYQMSGRLLSEPHSAGL